MKRNIKIIIAIIVLLIVIIVGIIELSKYHTYTVTVKKVGNNFILVEDENSLTPYSLVEGYIKENGNVYGSEVTIGNQTYVFNRYTIRTEDVIIKDDKGNKITTSDLELEDTLCVITKDGHRDSIDPLELENVKYIKVIKDK